MDYAVTLAHVSNASKRGSAIGLKIGQYWGGAIFLHFFLDVIKPTDLKVNLQGTRFGIM